MKTVIFTMLTILSAAAIAAPQSAGAMKEKPAMTAQDCGNMMQGMAMKGMDMKGMTPAQCNEMMTGAPKSHAAGNEIKHHAVAVVKKVDKARGTVRLDHQAVKSLNWPAMTMNFAVKDKRVLDKLSVGRKVNVEFVKQGSEFVVTAAK